MACVDLGAKVQCFKARMGRDAAPSYSRRMGGLRRTFRRTFRRMDKTETKLKAQEMPMEYLVQPCNSSIHRPCLPLHKSQQSTYLVSSDHQSLLPFQGSAAGRISARTQDPGFWLLASELQLQTPATRLAHSRSISTGYILRHPTSTYLLETLHSAPFPPSFFLSASTPPIQQPNAEISCRLWRGQQSSQDGSRAASRSQGNASKP